LCFSRRREDSKRRKRLRKIDAVLNAGKDILAVDVWEKVYIKNKDEIVKATRERVL